MTPETEQATSYIERLTEATSTGQITWRMANATTFVWERDDPGARVVVQRVVAAQAINGRVVQVENFILTVAEKPTNQTKVTLSSASTLELRAPLGRLFEVISSGVTRTGLDYFASILPKK